MSVNNPPLRVGRPYEFNHSRYGRFIGRVLAHEGRFAKVILLTAPTGGFDAAEVGPDLNFRFCANNNICDWFSVSDVGPPWQLSCTRK